MKTTRSRKVVLVPTLRVGTQDRTLRVHNRITCAAPNNMTRNREKPHNKRAGRPPVCRACLPHRQANGTGRRSRLLHPARKQPRFFILLSAFSAAMFCFTAPDSRAADSPEIAKEQETPVTAIVLYKGTQRDEVTPVLAELEKTFGMKFVIIKGFRKPPAAAYRKERNQYDASAVIKDVAAAKPRNALRVVGVMADDLFAGKMNFLFGISSRDAAAALVSLHKLRTGEEKRFRRRTLTEIVHELAHTFGLGHCEMKRCAMRFSNHLGDVDAKGPSLCKACRKKLREALEPASE